MTARTLAEWRDLAVELGQRAVARPLPPPAPTWPLTAAERARLEMRWPVAYEWAPMHGWVETLRRAFARLVRVTPADVPQPHPDTVMVRVVVDGAPADVAINVGDKMTIDRAVAERYPLVFKMQYRRGGYEMEHVVPGGFVPGKPSLYTYLDAVRRTRDRRAFRYDVYGRYSLEFAAGVRRRAVELLREQREFRYEGGLTKVRYSRFLAEIARAKICIDLPGNGDFCFRLVDYLAVGACVVGPRPRTELHVPLVHGEHVVYARDDLSDLVALCAHYLADDAARERIAANARAHFDAYLHEDQLAGYYLTEVLRRFGGGAPAGRASLARCGPGG